MSSLRDNRGRFTKGGVRITDTDRGMKSLLRNAREAAKGVGVSVGVHSGAGGELHKGEGKAPVTVLDVAIWNEFGMGVPERSFLRGWFDEARAVNMEKLRAAMKLMLKGQRSLPDAFELVGLAFVGAMQQRIARHIAPENAASTIEKKGSSTPLIDKGQLRQALTFLVRGKTPPA